MSSETGVRRMSPMNSQEVCLASIPDVPSNTCRDEVGVIISSNQQRLTAKGWRGLGGSRWMEGGANLEGKGR